ncbi:hypothetical protein FACS1894208_01180 [Clostridia bacterium]|nr:hypothetical protein FACS1894208_01180 [Clostridia bacterium]
MILVTLNNLITNGSFESTSGWADNQWSRNADWKKYGSYGAHAPIKTGSTSYTLMQSVDVGNLVAGHKFYCCAWVMTSENVSGALYFDVYPLTSGGKMDFMSLNPIPPSAMKKYSALAVLPNNFKGTARARMFVQNRFNANAFVERNSEQQHV